MKKLMLALAFVGFATATTAQENVPTKKHSVATNSFWSNWFVSVGGSYNATYTSQEKDVTANPFGHIRGSFSGSLSLGKWFTPGLGLRTTVDAGALRNVYTDWHPQHSTVKFVNIHEDVMFNLHNLIGGYDAERVWSFIPYVGFGYMRNCSADYDNFAAQIGFINDFRLSKRFSAFVDLQLLGAEPRMIGERGNGHSSRASIRTWDKVASVKVGLTYQLSKTCTWEKTPDLAAIMAMNQEQLDAMNEQLSAEQKEAERLRALLAAAEAKKPEVRIVKEVEFIGTTASVFFNTESSRIASRKDLVNVKELAEYAKANGKTIVVTGFADSRTGAADYNQKLSEKRANTVAEELVKMGVAEDKIVVKAEGGVDAIAPYSYNRRVTVKVQ
jgi:outer membrane protein OmpA-like peptidoglycan-associated protein